MLLDAREPDPGELARKSIGPFAGPLSGIPEEDLLRYVYLDLGYRLATWDTHMQRGNHHYIGYRLINKNGVVIFQGTDFGVPFSMSIDGDDTLRQLMGFLTLRPGDTDDEYFENYSPVQQEFAEKDAEEMNHWGMPEDQFDDDYPAPKFKDLYPSDHA